MSRCPTCGQEEKLSDPQRDRYFAMLQGYCRHPAFIAKGIKTEGLHLYLKDLFLPKRQVKRPDGISIVPASVSRKTGPGKMTMSEYMDMVEEWARDMGIWEAH